MLHRRRANLTFHLHHVFPEGTLDRSGADPTLFLMMWVAYLRLT